MRRIDYIVIHHSASPLSTKASDIDSWHRAKGWRCAGYHLICEESGHLVLGRQLDECGAHVRGKNRNTIGICLVGDNTRPESRWREIQIGSLQEILRVLCVLFPEAAIVGHRDLPGTATQCPGVDVRKLLNLEPLYLV